MIYAGINTNICRPKPIEEWKRQQRIAGESMRQLQTLCGFIILEILFFLTSFLQFAHAMTKWKYGHLERTHPLQHVQTILSGTIFFLVCGHADSFGELIVTYYSLITMKQVTQIL